MEYGKAELIYAEGEVCLMAVGSMVKTAEEVREILRTKNMKCSIVNARFVKPIDEYAAKWAADNHRVVVTMEENVHSGGYGEKVRDYLDLMGSKARLVNIALPDDYVEHGNVEQLKEDLEIDAKSIANKILGMRPF